MRRLLERVDERLTVCVEKEQIAVRIAFDADVGSVKHPMMRGAKRHTVFSRVLASAGTFTQVVHIDVTAAPAARDSTAAPVAKQHGPLDRCRHGATPCDDIPCTREIALRRAAAEGRTFTRLELDRARAGLHFGSVAIPAFVDDDVAPRVLCG